MARRSRRILANYFGNIARTTVFPMDLAGSKRQFVLIFIIRLFFLVGRRLWMDRCPRQAAALSYQTFLSLVPMLAIALAVATTLELDTNTAKVTDFLEANLLPSSAAAAGSKIRELVSAIKPKTLGFFGGITLVVISLTLLFTVEQIVNEIFRCKKKPKLWLRLITALFLLLLAPIAFGLSVYYSGKLLLLQQLASTLFPFLLSVATLFLCYWLLPHRKILVRHSLVSALAAGLLLELMKYGFAIYAQYLGATLSYVYGTLVILPLFMLWVYAAWIVFLFGAELNAALHEVKRHDMFK